MIPCPNCGKQIEDNAAHCGHCGHRIEVANKKTMMGLAAIDSAAIKDAVAQAKQGSQGGSAPKMKLPSPGAPRPDSQPQGGSAPSPGGQGLRLPRPDNSPAAGPGAFDKDDSPESYAKTEMLPSIQAQAEEQALKEASGPQSNSPEDDGITVETTRGFADTPAAQSPAAASPGDAGLFPDPEPGPAAAQGSLDPLQPSPMTPAGDFAPPSQGLAESTAPEDDLYAPDTVPSEMVGMGGQDGQMVAEAQGGQMVATEGEEKKSNKKLFMIIGGIFALFFFCCVVGNIVNFFIL